MSDAEYLLREVLSNHLWYGDRCVFCGRYTPIGEQHDPSCVIPRIEQHLKKEKK